ncbi:MAG TPA: MarR family transcriptional regulator [Acidobacteriaceae bacterium]|nr:MarR family transcriptional regulator [Acidobacteriaceae bacterium]
MTAASKTSPSPRSALRKLAPPASKPIGLQAELRQTKPFTRLHDEAFLNLVRTSAQLQHALHLRLKPYGITETQYNSLRILRGAGAGSIGLTCAEIAERLVSQDPDITRLVERLQRQGLVRRERGEKDRRVVLTKITAAGLDRLKEIDPVVNSTVNALLSHLSSSQLKTMIDLLERARLFAEPSHQNG